MQNGQIPTNSSMKLEPLSSEMPTYYVEIQKLMILGFSVFQSVASTCSATPAYVMQQYISIYKRIQGEICVLLSWALLSALCSLPCAAPEAHGLTPPSYSLNFSYLTLARTELKSLKIIFSGFSMEGIENSSNGLSMINLCPAGCSSL